MSKKRSEVNVNDTWDLSSLCKDISDWKARFSAFEKEIEKAQAFKGTLGNRESLLSCFEYVAKTNIDLEVIYSYANLSYECDGKNPVAQDMIQRSAALYARYGQAMSFFEPELLSQSEEYLDACANDPAFADYRVFINKLKRQKPHTLSEKEEHLLALASQPLGNYIDTFQTLNNVDFKFKDVFGKELTHATFATFVKSDDENVRKEAYKNMYATYLEHENTIASIYSGSVQKDIFYARARGFNTAIEAKLYPDNVPLSVYTGLIEEVHNAFPLLHRYYALLAKKMGKEKIMHYDVYLPLTKNIDFDVPYEKAVEIISEAVKPLGEEYREVLVKGLTTERWVDRYENEGKRSGAFSAGCFTGKPYILTNYDPSLVRSVATLIHEGGHSMHSYYSAKNNPILSYDYTIFEAEVASTFNEELLSHYMIEHAKNEDEKNYLISTKLADIVSTLFRQTMFAEYEYIVHTKAEKGESITASSLREIYGKLLRDYFGPQVEFEEYSNLEGMRIPHFYTPYYVYKYATGICASISLSERVLNGGDKEREEYLSFLKSGGSHYPIDSLRLAGVDMASRDAIKTAIKRFESLLDEAEALLNK